MSYRLLSAELATRSPKEIVWRAIYDLGPGYEHDSGYMRLNENTLTNLDGVEVPCYSPAARLALKEAAPDDMRAILVAVNLDAQRYEDGLMATAMLTEADRVVALHVEAKTGTGPVDLLALAMESK
jgi:hypothetical protein